MSDLTDLGNLIVDSGATLSWGVAESCRCLCCREFQLRDCDDKLIVNGDTLEELLHHAEETSNG